MTKVNSEKIGACTALLIGLPCGIFFSLAILYISLFPMLDLGLAVIGGRLFWHPVIWAGLIPATFILLLWKAGKKIRTHLDKKYSLLQTSFQFTLFVNSWLFGLIVLIFMISGLFFSLNKISLFSHINLIAIGLTASAYIISTAFTTLTIGLLIVKITKNKIYR